MHTHKAFCRGPLLSVSDHGLSAAMLSTGAKKEEDEGKLFDPKFDFFGLIFTIKNACPMQSASLDLSHLPN